MRAGPSKATVYITDNLLDNIIELKAEQEFIRLTQNKPLWEIKRINERIGLMYQYLENAVLKNEHSAAA